jgi:multidrug efflux pump subunit AcrA (membrane-fusion protein)
MKFSATSGLTVSSLALSAFLAGVPALAQDNRVDAGGMPTTHSTPQEHAGTADLNNTVTNSNISTDQQASTGDAQNQQQYQQQQQQYQDQLQQSQKAQQDYQQKSQAYADQTAQYESLRARFAAERAAYHRGLWPDRYARFTVDQYTADLLGQRVEILNGDHVGTVRDVSRMPNGQVEALLVQLDNDKVVWIDRTDIRYDRADGIVMTNLDSRDLRQMADERL